MITYVFDFNGTVEGNPSLRPDQVRTILHSLRAAGHRVLLWTGGVVPGAWVRVFDEVHHKPDMGVWSRLTGQVVYFDDDTMLLRAVQRINRRREDVQIAAWSPRAMVRFLEGDDCTGEPPEATPEEMREIIRRTNTTGVKASGEYLAYTDPTPWGAPPKAVC